MNENKLIEDNKLFIDNNNKLIVDNKIDDTKIIDNTKQKLIDTKLIDNTKQLKLIHFILPGGGVKGCFQAGFMYHLFNFLNKFS